MKEKYTVVIPSRNSLHTLKYTLQTCLSQTYENFEIIISDNCSEDGTEDYIAALKDPRIIYYKTGRLLSMTDNFEFALSKATSGFIMCIGADDGLMPDAIHYVNSLIQNSGLLVAACQYAHYFWPDAPVPQHGRLTLNGTGIHKSNVEIRQAPEWIKKTIAFQSSLYVCDLPSLYYGFVHRSVIDKAMKDGKYFRSITPDAYSAFATACHIKEYVYSNRPFVIAGISGKSNGLSQTIGSDISKQFVAENTHPIHRDFVFCTAFEVILSEAYKQFADAFPGCTSDYTLDYRKMLRLSIRRKYGKNQEEAIAAIKKMAEIHNIPFSEIQNNYFHKLSGFINRTVRLSKDVFLKSGKYISVKDTEPMGIKNVAEAGILLEVMEKLNNGYRIETVWSKFTGRIKKRLGVRKYQDAI